MFQRKDLLWVKNVKRENGTDWAYFDDGTENEFHLNFSEDQKKGAYALKEGEIILLFQRVDKVPNIPTRTYLTHLIVALDNEVIYNPDISKHPWERRVAVLARANPRTAIYTTSSKLNFFKPNWGKLCSIELLNDKWTKDQIAKEIWSLFESHLNSNLQEYISQISNVFENPSDINISSLEGVEKEIMRRHIFRERDPRLVNLAKLKALEKGNGTIVCECCDFDFNQVYGEHGHTFIECHHKYFISNGERVNTIEDLAMVCSNCHRMLHRKNKDGKYFEVKELKYLINSLKY